MRLSLADGALEASSSVKLVGHGGEYAAFADEATVGGALFKDIALAASRKGDLVDFKAVPPVPRRPGGPIRPPLLGGGRRASAGLPLVACEGSVSFGPDPNLELSVDLETLDLQPLKPILAVLTDSPEAASILSSLKLGGSLFASSDFKRFSWSAPDITLVSSAAPGAFALLSLAGSAGTLSVKHALVSASGYSVEGSGKIDLSESGRLGFDASFTLKDIPYAMRGYVAGQGLSITGDYGLEVSARTADKDTYVSAKARGLPLPLGGGLFLATVDAEGRFASLRDWHLSVSDFDLVPTGENLAVVPSISLAGDFGPSGAVLASLRIADKLSTLSGDGTLAYSLDGPPTARIAARLSAPLAAKDASAPESYAIDASYATGRLQGVVDMVASPLARLGKLPFEGSVDGRIAFMCDPSDLAKPGIDFSLKLRDGRYLDQTLAVSGSGSYSGQSVSLHDVSVAYQGQAISNGAAIFGFADASSSLSFDFAGAFSGLGIKFSLSAQGASTKAGGSIPDMLANYEAKGSLIGLAVGSSSPTNWPFSASSDDRSVSFVGGGAGELRFKYAASGAFSANLRAPFPVRAEVSCLFEGRNIDLSARGIDFDLGLLEPLMPSALIKIVSGRATGGFRAVGLASDPEITGEMDIEDASLKVLGWLADDAGPFRASIIATGRRASVSVPSIPVGKAAVALDCQAGIDHWIPAGLTASVRTLVGSRVRADSVILGIHAQGDAAADLKFALEGDVLNIDCDVLLDKGTVVVSPATWAQGAADTSRPQPFLAVSTNVHFGRGVQVFFPSINIPAVMGYSDPSSLLAIRYDQASDDYTLNGSVILRGGEVFYIQRDFFLKTGRIVFNEGRDHFDPRATLLAELRDRIDEAPVLITLQADNSPISGFQPKLSSDPPMTESQIALLMGETLVGASPNGAPTVAGVDTFRKAVISTSDLIVPQLNFARLFEDRIRDTFGLDMFYFRTQVLQNWLIDLSGNVPTGTGDALSRYLDQTQLFAGKYVTDSIFSHASLSLISNPLAGSNTLTLNSDLGVDLELGIEMDSPFGIFQWNVDSDELGRSIHYRAKPQPELAALLLKTRRNMKRLAILTSLFLYAAALSAQATDQGAAPAVPRAADPTAAAASSTPPEGDQTPAPAATPAAGPSAEQAPQPAAPQAETDWFWGKPIASVEWEGVVHADKRELDSTTRNYIGKAFTEDLWLEIQSKVYELDWFEKIDPTAVPTDSSKTKVTIKISVTEKPAIEAVRASGNSGLKSSDILDAVTEKAGEIYTQPKARVDELAVRRLYLEHGYPDATVTSSTSKGKAKDSVILTFSVTEGSQVAVKEIRFSGNTAVSSQTLKGRLSIKESGFLQNGAFQESKLEDDKKTIVDYYKSRGYVDAAVEDVVRTYEKDAKTSKNWLILTIAVKEGKQWFFGGINFSGNTIFPTSKLAGYVSDKPGAILNLTRLTQEKSKIDDLYYESGYIYNTSSLEETRDQDRHSIAYQLKIVEQDRAHIESITFKGNKKTKDFVLYRELPLEVGDIFSKAKILEGLRNLYNLQYFTAVDPQMFPARPRTSWTSSSRWRSRALRTSSSA